MAKRILVLDDEKHTAVMVKAILKKFDYEVIWARSRSEATSFLNNSYCDLVVSDFRLPDGDGLTWMSSMREQGHYIPFVMLSGFSMNQEMQKRLRNLLGVKFILEKPIDIKRFPDCVATAITQTRDEIEAIFLNEVRSKKACSESNMFRELNDMSDADLENFDPFETYTSSEFEQEDIVAPLYQNEHEGTGETKSFSLVTFLEDASKDEEGNGMNEFQDILDHRLEELKIDYLKELPNTLKVLAEKIETALEKSDNDAELVRALVEAHSLQSSAGSHSFMAVAEIARQVESCLEALSLRKQREKEIVAGMDLESGAYPIVQNS